MLDGALCNDVPDLAIGPHDAHLERSILAVVVAAVRGHFGPVVGVAGVIERRQGRRARRRVKAIDLVDLVGPVDAAVEPAVVPIAEASHLRRERRQPLEVLHRRSAAGEARSLASIFHGPFSPTPENSPADLKPD